MSFNWISGGAMIRFNSGLARAASARWRWMRRMVWSSADRNAERSRGANDFGPPVTSPDERRSVIRLRTASVMPIDCFRERLAVRRDHLGAGLDAAARQRNIRGDDDIALARAFRDPVVGGVHPGTGRDALDQRILRHPDELPGDHADRQAMAGGDAVDLVLDRAGVGVDIDAGGVQIRRHRLRIVGRRLSRSSARGTPSRAELRGKQRRNTLATAVSWRTIIGAKEAKNQGKQA